jgi:drug/metabolite transporter (DMT)-like permease
MLSLLALVSSLSWGAADFLGGLSSRRGSTVATLAISYPIGAVFLTGIGFYFIPGFVSVEVLGWSLAAGIVGISGIGMLYLALARGTMGTVSPITAVASAAVPVAFAAASGESLSVWSISAMALALAAVYMVTRERPRGQRARALSLVLALSGGVALGCYLTIIGSAPPGSGIWVVTLGRWVSTSLIVLILVLRAKRTGLPQAPWILALGAGILDASANALFQVAAQSGNLAVIAVMGSLYPVTTVLLARFVLNERLGRLQGLGVAFALVAATALALQ